MYQSKILAKINCWESMIQTELQRQAEKNTNYVGATMIRIMTDFLLKEIESTVQCSKNLKCWKEKKKQKQKTKTSQISWYFNSQWKYFFFQK